MNRPGRVPVLRPQVVAMVRLGFARAEIARRLGISMQNVYDHIKFARLKGELAHAGDVQRLDPLPEPETKVERCKCGLALPCNDCLRPIHWYAGLQSRDAE